MTVLCPRSHMAPLTIYIYIYIYSKISFVIDALLVIVDCVVPSNRLTAGLITSRPSSYLHN